MGRVHDMGLPKITIHYTKEKENNANLRMKSPEKGQKERSFLV